MPLSLRLPAVEPRRRVAGPLPGSAEIVGPGLLRAVGHPSGSILLEALVAAAATATISVALVGALLAATQDNTRGQMASRVTSAAASSVEGILALPFDHPTLRIAPGETSRIERAVWSETAVDWLPTEEIDADELRLLERITTVRSYGTPPEGSSQFDFPLLGGEEVGVPHFKRIDLEIRSPERVAGAAGQRLRLTVLRAL